MAAKSKKVMQNGSPKENNALKRFLHLPVVNSACNSLQKFYTTTKEVHPLMALVCGAYERCIRSATSLVAWSIKPMAHQLGPPVATVNALACQGLDRLEQKIPALHKPVEKVTSDVKDSILTYIRSAIHSSMNIFGAFGLVARNYEECKISMNNTAEYVRSGRVSQEVEAGADATPAHEPPEECVSKEAFQTSAFGKIRAFGATVSQHPYRQISRAIQHARDKAKALAMWIPSLFPKVLAEEERAASRAVAHSGPSQQLEDAPSIAAHPKGSEFTFLLHGERRLSRGHFPIPFINLDDPPVPQQTPDRCRGRAFETEHLGSRKSALSPYTDGAYSRRRSEGILRTSPEVMHGRAQYTGLYSTTFKKD